MKKLFMIIVFTIFWLVNHTSAQIIHIPGDYPTIQQGVNEASEGDTVLVSPGTYFENISLNGTNITLASFFLTTNDTSYISSTIIDGDQNGSVITIEEEEDSTTRITGFSITNGGNVYSGGGFFIVNADPSLDHLYIYNNHAAGGGGLYLGSSFSTIDQVRIFNNYCESIGNWYVRGGGGLLIENNTGDGNVSIKNSLIAGNSSINKGGGLVCSYALLELENTDIIGNVSEFGGGIYSGGNYLSMDPVNRCNIYSNTALVGNDLYNAYSPDIQLNVDTFTVLVPTNFHVNDTTRFQFDILNGKLSQVNADLYISPSGDDENNGLSPGNPLRTIHTAISKLLPFSGDTNTLFLAAGMYSTTATSEFFPVNLPDYIYLEGDGDESTILDAEGKGPVIRIYGNSFNEVSAMTLTGGISEEGGGVYCRSENTTLKDLNIIGNEAEIGGGIFTTFCEPVIEDCKIQGNTAVTQGGGIYMETDPDYWHYPHLTGLMISDNHAEYGGGIAVDPYIISVLKGVTVCYNTAEKGGGIFGISGWSFPTFDTTDRCNIYLNSALIGNDLYTGGQIDVVVDTFTVMNPTEFHAYPLFYCTFDILNSKLNQVENDLFVSPDGDNANTGLTADDPLKTIHHALTVILATEDNQRQIHLLDGTYSPATNGEFFPINLIDYVHLTGTADSLVILDAESTSGVMQIMHNDTNHVSDLTLTGGSATIGAGLHIVYSHPFLERLIISGNTAGYSGGGVFCEISHPVLDDIRISGNYSNSHGGGIYLEQSWPELNNVIISQNTAASSGGGVTVASSSNPGFNNVVISENVAPAGAGIYNYGRLELLDCDVSGNTSTWEGGGIFTADSIWLVNTVVKENTAESGGGLYVKSNSSARLDTVDLSENMASYQGGGLCSEGGANTWLNNAKISGNNSAMYGGGIYGESNSNLFLSGSTISYNHADYAGGGMMWWTYISTHFDSTDRCNIYLNSADNGNDLFSSYDTVEIIVDTFTVMYPTEYHAEYKNKFIFDILAGKLEQTDADLYVSPDGDNSNTGLTPDDPLKTIDRAFSKIRADRDHQHTIHLATGIYSPSGNGEVFPLRIVNYSSLSGESRLNTILDAEETGQVLDLYYDTIPAIENLTVTGGNTPYNGAGIDCNNTDINFNNIRIAGNISGMAGGGLYIGYSDNIALMNMIIEDNEAAENGGGIFTRNSSTDMFNVDLIHNSAINGGGIYLEYPDMVLMDKMKFTANTASQNGGALYALNSNDLTITSSEINSNTAWKGGGIWMENSSPVLKNSLVVNNTALQHSGGIGIYNDYYSPSDHESGFYNVTLANNSAPGLFCYSAGVRLINSIFWDNANQYQIQYMVAGENDDTLRVSNTDIQNGLNGILISGTPIMEWLEGNIDEDPLFVNSGEFPYSLDDGSPCIDAGTPDTTGLFLPFNDLIGNTRVWDGDGDGTSIIDMGPYEYGAPVTVPGEGSLNKLNSGNTYIYPNPANDHFTICSDDTQSDRVVTIVNSTGHLVHSLVIPAGQGKQVISLDQFIQGLYTLLFSNENGVYSVMKVVVIN
jgi:predicted outer membrane repeat protein